MYPVLPLLALTLPGPTVLGAPIPADVQWAAVASCPRVSPGTGAGPYAAAVCVGQRDEFAYLLTAAHAVPKGEARAFEFYTRPSYPRPARTLTVSEVVLRLADPDLALVKVPVGPDPLPTARLAGPGQRPKKFPTPALSVGCPAGSPPVGRAERIDGKKLVRRPDGGVAFFWEVAVPPIGGMSGGPLLGADGRVIGLCTAGQEGRGYFVHLDEILAGLKREGYGWLFEPPSR